MTFEFTKTVHNDKRNLKKTVKQTITVRRGTEKGGLLQQSVLWVVDRVKNGSS